MSGEIDIMETRGNDPKYPNQWVLRCATIGGSLIALN